MFALALSFVFPAAPPPAAAAEEDELLAILAIDFGLRLAHFHWNTVSCDVVGASL